MSKARKLPSGSWRCLVYSHTESVYDEKKQEWTDKRIYESFTCDDPSPAGRRKVEAMAAEFALNKTRAKTSTITFEEAVDKYIESRKSVLSPRTIGSYRQIRHTNLKSLMNIRIDRITQEDIQKAVNFESISHSPKTVRNFHGLISAVMSQYRPEFVIHTELPKRVRANIYVPSDAEIRNLMDIVKGTDMELPILLAAFGPMRRGEICALTTDNINGNIVHVCQNMIKSEDKQWIIKTPKTYAGDRYIDYPDFVAEKWKGKSGRIVLLSPDVITNRFNRLLDKNEIPHFRFHDLRHYSASVQHALGIPDAYIMQRGGWGNDSVLKNVYRHVMEDKQKEMSEIANQHFENLCNTKCNTN